jgi:hypothetical protein
MFQKGYISNLFANPLIKIVKVAVAPGIGFSKHGEGCRLLTEENHVALSYISYRSHYNLYIQELNGL